MLDRLLDFIASALDLFRFWVVIAQYENGVVLRLGKFRRVLEPGLHFIIPFGVDDVLTDNVVTSTFNMTPQSLTTKDGQSVVISAVMTWAIKDVRKTLLEVEGAEDVAIDSCYGIIGQMVASRTWDEVRAPDFAEEITKAVRRRAFRYGIEVQSIQISDLSRTRSLRLWHSGSLNR